MSAGLRDVLELPEAKQAELNELAEQFRQSFSEGMEGLNRHFQLMAGQANPADYGPLEAQKMKLYEAFQKTSAMIDPRSPDKSEQSIQRVMGALKSIEGKASEAAAGITAGRDEWSKREEAFDDVLIRVGELEDAGNSKAATLRKLAETIRGKANERSYDQSVTAFDQLRPKFDQIYQQHQQAVASNAPGRSGELPLGGVFPEILWEQSQGDFKQSDQKVRELEDTQLPKAAILRKAMDTIKALSDQNKLKEALAGYQKLRPQVDAEYEKLLRSRGGGVQLPFESKSKSSLAGGAAVTSATKSAAKGSAGFITGSVGKGGKNNPTDVKAVQEALNQRGGAKLTADGKFGPKTLKAIEEFQKKLGQFKPDGVIQPGRGTARALSGAAPIPPTPPEPKPIKPPVLGKASLDKGALVWHSTRGILNTNIEELKKGVRAAYGTEHEDLVTAIDGSMVKLGKVVDKLDTRLADALDSANKAQEGPARVVELKKAESIMQDYLQYVNSEPLIGHMDNNPFGVTTSLQQIVGDALNHLGELIPPSVDATA